MIILYILFIIITLSAIVILKREPKRDLYGNGWEKHDLETWRERGIETAKSRNDKSIIKHTDALELIGVLYIIHGWNLTKCK